MDVYVIIISLFILICVCEATVYEDFFKETNQERSVRAKFTSLNVDDSCVKWFGKGSYMCRTSYKTGYDYICGSLLCLNPRSQLCEIGLAPQDSTLCGNGKWCDASTCQRNPNAEVTTDACPLGDSARADVILGMDCNDIVTNKPYLCNSGDVNVWCCDSCSKLNKTAYTGSPVSADDACKDLEGNSSFFCQNSYNQGDFHTICSSMSCYKNQFSNCISYSAPDGISCGNGRWCDGGQCVVSTMASTNPVGDCLFGNQYQQFCAGNVVYPNIAKYCKQYEAVCCGICLQYKNTSSPAGCEYGDEHPDVCKSHVTDGTINSFCHTNEIECCQTCKELKSGSTNAACPFGDVDPAKCKALMADNIGPGNCYSQTHQQECCDTCPEYFNATRVGCEYGDHWDEYCAANVKPPNVASTCSQYETQCCESCGNYREHGHAGCVYGDTDPTACKALMQTDLATANCYNRVTQSQCCETCEELKDTSTPNCLYGDNKPANCERYFNDSKGIGNCYDFGAQIDCCRSCAQVRNDSNKGCEYGDHLQEYCSTNIVGNSSAFLCFQAESQCCETCANYKVSNNPDCKYGDKNPFQCKFSIPDARTAAIKCPTQGLDCCATCSRLGHPGPGGVVSDVNLVG